MSAQARLRELITADIREHYPANADKADAIIDKLLELPQMQADDAVIQFINAYQRAVEKRDSGIQ